MKSRSRHATGLTLLTTAALAIALSFAPIPDDLRPFPAMARGSVDDVVAAVLPDRARRPDLATVEDSTVPLEPETDEAAELAAAPPPVAMPGAALTPLPEDLPLRLLGVADARESGELERLRAKVRARHVEIEQGCRQMAAAGVCATPALAPFFRELDALLGGSRRKPVRVVHLGDSLIASDHISDVVRARLQARFGSGGKGFLFVDRPTRGAGRGVRAGTATPGWEIAKITDRGGPSRRVGFSGVAFSAAGPEQVDFDVSGARFAELFFLTDPKGGALQLRADGEPVGRIFTRFNHQEPAFARTRVPPGARTLTLAARGAVSLYGVALEGGGPGVVYDSVGIPGATAKIVLRSDPSLFKDQLAHRDPSLVLIMLGGNEAFEMSRRETKAEEARASMQELVRRIRQAVPDSACLLTAPMDAATRNLAGTLVPRQASQEVAGIIREVALEGGCAYWDMFAAMGGKGSVARWLDAGVMNEDLVHPLGRGADLMGHLLDMSLARAHLGWRGGAALEDPPGLEAAHTLAPLFERLAALEAGQSTRVGVVQFGASHTASHYFTDVVRNRLAGRYGASGRGFVAAGRSSRRLFASGTSRELTGDWTVLDPVSNPGTPANLWALTGTRAEGKAGATASFSFCEDCKEDARSRLQLHYLEEPGMGRLEVRLDGTVMAVLPHPEQKVAHPAARVLEFEAPGAKHTLSVTNTGPGPVTLFGAAHELARKGVVVDAVGLPGSTIFTLAGLDANAFAEQLRARRPDAFFFFYGTNESARPDLNLHEMRLRYDQVFGTLRAVAPQAACLLIGPTDRQELGPNGVWREAPSQRTVIPALREVARAHGCAFWSARAAMGGPGAVGRWLERNPPLAHPDHVHLTEEGYTLLANALAEDLLAARPPPKEASR